MNTNIEKNTPQTPHLLKTKKNVLIFSYCFPPTGGIIGMHTLKLAKYLIDYNWNPIIITSERGPKRFFDETYINEISSLNIKVIRPTENYDTSEDYFDEWSISNRLFKRLLLLPDAAKEWGEYAAKAAEPYLQKPDYIDLVYSVSPVWTNHIVAAQLRSKYNVPTIIHYKSLWREHPCATSPTSYHTNTYREAEIKAIKSANVVLTANRYIKESIVKKYYQLLPQERVAVLENGFDEQDIKPSATNNVFRLVYVGDIPKQIANRPFLQAISTFIETKLIATDPFEICIVGKIDTSFAKEIALHKYTSHFKLYHQIPFSLINDIMHSASAFLLFTSNQYESNAVSLTKLPMIIGYKKPILALTTDPYFVSVMKRANSFSASHDIANDISDRLVDLYKIHRSQKPFESNPELIQTYTYRNIASIFTQIANKIMPIHQ